MPPAAIMSAPRFFFPSPLPVGDVFELTEEAAHHAIRVLRLRPNDAVQVFDGEGHALDAVIRETGGKRVWVEKTGTLAHEPQSALHIVLAQAMCSSEKMDWIVQKATELGVAEIQPVQTQRSVAKLSAERAQRRAEHWRNVIVSACEQCGRNTLPQIHAPQDLGAWLAQMRSETGSKFMLSPEGASALPQQTRPQNKALLLIGPEGGLESGEELMAKQAGFLPVLLGPRILRTETAALAGVTALQALWGDFC